MFQPFGVVQCFASNGSVFCHAFCLRAQGFGESTEQYHNVYT